MASSGGASPPLAAPLLIGMLYLCYTKFQFRSTIGTIKPFDKGQRLARWAQCRFFLFANECPTFFGLYHIYAVVECTVVFIMLAQMRFCTGCSFRLYRAEINRRVASRMAIVWLSGFFPASHLNRLTTSRQRSLALTIEVDNIYDDTQAPYPILAVFWTHTDQTVSQSECTQMSPDL